MRLAAMNIFLTLPLLAVILAGFGSAPASAKDVGDHGQVPAANQATGVPGIRLCGTGAGKMPRIDPRQPVTILVHGYNGSPAHFSGLAEALVAYGQQTVCFEYNDRNSLMVISGQLVNAIDLLAKLLITPRITVIGHSIGGLIARKALIVERRDPVRNKQIDLQLLTISAPFSGISSARTCSNPALRSATLGLLDYACWIISGDSWREITASSGFISRPGNLKSQVRRHLMVVTDERGSCRFRLITGWCIKDDYVFSLAEQEYSPVTQAPRTKTVIVRAGHAEIIGENGAPSRKLLELLMREHIVGTAK